MTDQEMYCPEVVGKPRMRQRQLLLSTFGAFGTWHLNSYLVSVHISEHPPSTVTGSWVTWLFPCPIMVHQWALANRPSLKSLWSAVHPQPGVHQCRHHTHTCLHEHPSTLTLPSPCSPRNAVPWELQRGCKHCVTLADHHFQATWRWWPSPSSLQPSSQSGDVNPKVNLTSTLNYVVSHFCMLLQNVVVVTVKKISFLALPSAGTPAFPRPSNELPPLLQTTCKNQGKQELMLQFNTSAFSITSLLISLWQFSNLLQVSQAPGSIMESRGAQLQSPNCSAKASTAFCKESFHPVYFFPKQTCCWGPRLPSALLTVHVSLHRCCKCGRKRLVPPLLRERVQETWHEILTSFSSLLKWMFKIAAVIWWLRC